MSLMRATFLATPVIPVGRLRAYAKRGFALDEPRIHPSSRESLPEEGWVTGSSPVTTHFHAELHCAEPQKLTPRSPPQCPHQVISLPMNLPTRRGEAPTIRKTDTGLSPVVAKWSRVTMTFPDNGAIE
jgi:hypothetical protein